MLEEEWLGCVRRPRGTVTSERGGVTPESSAVPIRLTQLQKKRGIAHQYRVTVAKLI